MIFIHREAGEELQMAEVKLAMHKEMLGKDEVGLRAIQSLEISSFNSMAPQEITSLRSSLGSVSTEREQLAGEVDALKLEVGSPAHFWKRRIHQGRLGTWVRLDM